MFRVCVFVDCVLVLVCVLFSSVLVCVGFV